ncbi:MAG: hypothetical protein ACOX61_13050, partial [Brooklawnia sp.]
DEEVMTNERFGQLPDDEKARIEAAMKTLQERLQKVIRQVQQMQKEKRQRIRDLGRDMCHTTVVSLVDDLRRERAELPGVLDWLDHLQADVLEHLDEFRRDPEARSNNPLAADAGELFFSRYDVNVVIGDSDEGAGAPIVSEDNPTYPNRSHWTSRSSCSVTACCTTCYWPTTANSANCSASPPTSRTRSPAPRKWKGSTHN